MEQDFIVDFIAKIAHENMVVVRSIFLVGIVGLISPVDTNFLDMLLADLTLSTMLAPRLTYRLVDAASVEALHCAFCSTWIVKFDETVVEPFILVLLL